MPINYVAVFVLHHPSVAKLPRLTLIVTSLHPYFLELATSVPGEDFVRIHSSINDESQKRMLVELQACMKSDCCPQVNSFLLTMQLIFHIILLFDLCKLVVEGLNFMKEQMNLIHRDVKPSNILLNKQGSVKICDFGISGHLTNSVAKTVNAGCKPYMPPERIDGERKVAYDVRADVWSLGITLVEIASGSHPYAKWKTPFEQLKQQGSISKSPPDGLLQIELCVKQYH
uniref:mitogen-activated protein kinase kinase n=1 Tax=Parascaris equorum TaxID=6256 RepID=A0A914S429_PAREQ